MAHNRYVAEPFALLLFFCTVGAYALGHVVYALYLIAVRVCDRWYGQFLQTEGAVAYLTVEMHVAVIVHIAVGVAQLVAYALAAVVNLVEQVVFLKKHQSAEYAGLIDRVNLILQLGHGERSLTLRQRLQDQQPISCRLDPVLRQYVFRFVHDYALNSQFSILN